jgi:hypothetical protein
VPGTAQRGTALHPCLSAVNLLALRLTPRIGMILGMLALVGTAAFLAGLVLMGALP